MPVSISKQRANRKLPPPVAPTTMYRITDPSHKPDLHGHFGGVKVHRHQDGHQIVHMTDKQARFYKDQGAIEVFKPAEKEVAKSAPVAAKAMPA